jgi:hypothetical protein
MEIAFVLAAIADVMAPGQHAPHLGTETEHAWKLVSLQPTD